MSLTMQVLLDVKCLVLLLNVTRYRKARVPSSVVVKTALLKLVAFLVLQVLNFLSLCEPSPSRGDEGLAPCTPSSLHACSKLVFGSCVLESHTF